jgi:hypothetical protein
MSELTRRLIADLGRDSTVEVLIVNQVDVPLDDAVEAIAKEPTIAAALPKQRGGRAQPTIVADARKANVAQLRPAPRGQPPQQNRTVAAALRDLIQRGLDDDKIWARIKTEFPHLEDSKKSYIQGQRRVLDRKAAEATGDNRAL